MEKYYTDERNVQILLYLLKVNGIRKVVASPGTTNITLVASMQQDPFFQIYSSVDERSAAYIACGLSAESGEPVVLSCTGATASRNYISGLTEAYYRKLPILAITSTQRVANVGHHIAQVIDRSSISKDIARYSVLLPVIHDNVDEWNCEIKANEAILELYRNGGGPVHINLETTYSSNFSVKELPKCRVLRRYNVLKDLPKIPSCGKIGIFVGVHNPWDREEVQAIDAFCKKYNAVVFCDHTSNYKGEYRVLYSLVASQDKYKSELLNLELLIHIGEISGDYATLGALNSKEVWRVSKDGEIRDTFKKIKNVFEMEEKDFFSYYKNQEFNNLSDRSFKELLDEEYLSVYNNIGELPFSNIWISKIFSSKIPDNSVLHIGILNSLRSMNFFELPKSVLSFSNVGGFGIDGDISSLIGASLINKDKLYFGILGDLAFFYDLNVIGNRHVGNNVRIILINNGKGVEFRNPYHPAYQFGEDAENYIAASGHYGNKSKLLVKDFVENLEYKYLFATNKEEFINNIEIFTDVKSQDRSIIFEIFTNTEDEQDALSEIHGILKDSNVDLRAIAGKCLRNVLSEEGVNILKKIIK